jgi:hypothetical protein
VKHVHRNDSHRLRLRTRLNRSQRISDGEFRTKARLVQVSKALAELYELIEKYSPVFYTKRHHDHATAALRLVGKLR